MSTTSPDNTPATTGQVVLPPGWSAGPARETTSTNAAGQLTQGVQIPLMSSAGTAVTVFIPNLILEQGAQAVQAVITAKINAISAIPGQVL